MWRDYKTQTFDDQDKFFLPWNSISTELRHDTRLCISMLQKEPWTYIVTKVNNTTPKGIITFTVKQDRYEPEHDYVQLNPNEPDYGDMYPDFWSSSIIPKQNEENVLYKKSKLAIEAPNYKIKFGYSKVLTAKIYDSEDNDITDMYKDSECIWDFKLENTDLVRKKLIVIDEAYSLKEGNKFKCKFKFDGDEKHLNQNIFVTCRIDDMTAKIPLDVSTL